MMLDQMEKHPGARFLFMFAGFVVVVTGLKAAAGVLMTCPQEWYHILC